MNMTTEDRDQLLADLIVAIRRNLVHECLSDEELAFVRLMLKKQSQSIAFRQAVIEKTLTGLLWASLVFVGGVFLEWAKNHGFKP